MRLDCMQPVLLRFENGDRLRTGACLDRGRREKKDCRQHRSRASQIHLHKGKRSIRRTVVKKAPDVMTPGALACVLAVASVTRWRRASAGLGGRARRAWTRDVPVAAEVREIIA